MPVISLLSGWRHGALVVSHDRELLETMDAVVELTTLGATRYGGNWSDYRARKALELAAAEHDLADAKKRVAEVARSAQETAERKARKDSAGKKKAAKGDMPRIVAGGLKRQAESTSGENARLAGRRHTQALEDAEEARKRIEILQPLSVKLPSTGLPPKQIGTEDRHRHGRLRDGRTHHPQTVLRYHRPRTCCRYRPQRLGQDDVARADFRRSAAVGRNGSSADLGLDARPARQPARPGDVDPRQFPTAESAIG